MQKIVLFSCLFTFFGVHSQVDNHSQVKAELMEWDAVRGEWLAESFYAMSNNQDVPDRTFPEDITPSELYSMVPSDRQDRIRTILNQQSNVSQPRQPATNTPNRVPVGDSPRIPNAGAQRDRYTNYFTNNACNLIMGRTYGDPHIRTFDGKSYSFQTVGEYILSSSSDQSFQVQTRQRPETNSVSLNTAVAMNVFGDRVGIYASDVPGGDANVPVRVNGRSVYLNNETYYLPRGGTIQNNGKEYVVTWPTGEKVQAKLATSSGMRFMNVSLYVRDCRGDYYGLMGNANGRSDDDFSGDNSRMNLASSTIFDPFDSRDFGRGTSAMERDHLAFLARDFGNQFLVNDMNTLFEYNFGQSSWSYYDPSFPRTHLTLGDISQADRERARRECERQGILGDDMNGCVMDFAHANIPPNPRPVVPNRPNGGRALDPVSNRKPNVNRTDVYERVPSSSGGRGVTPSTIGDRGGVERKPSTVTLPEEKVINGTSNGNVRTPVPNQDRNSKGEEYKTIETPVTKPSRPNGEVVVPIRKPVGEPTKEINSPQPVSPTRPVHNKEPFERRPIESQPATRPSTQPVKNNDPQRSNSGGAIQREREVIRTEPTNTGGKVTTKPSTQPVRSTPSQNTRTSGAPAPSNRGGR